MKIHEVLKTYLDLTGALIGTPEEIEAYNTLRILEEKLTPKFEKGDEVISVNNEGGSPFKVHFLSFELQTQSLYYESDDVREYGIESSLVLVSKGEPIDKMPEFKIGDKVIILKTKKKATVYQIVDYVCYLKGRDGKIYSERADNLSYDKRRN